MFHNVLLQWLILILLLNFEVLHLFGQNIFGL